MKDPPLNEKQLIDAKHGLAPYSTRLLAETALYWYDEAAKLRLLLEPEAALAVQEKQQP